MRVPRMHLVGIVLAAVAWTATAAVLATQPQLPLDRLQLIPTTLTVVCGAIVVLRTDTRLIGWLLITAGVMWPLFSVLSPLGPAPPPRTPVTEFLDTLGTQAHNALLLLLLVFPSGGFDSRLSRGAAVIALAPSATLPLEALAAVGVLDGAPEVPAVVHVVTFVAVLALGLALQVKRYRRRSRTHQLQVKWFLFAMSAFLVYPVILAFDLRVGPVADIVVPMAVPVAVLVALTRHRLYEIDRIISRTVAYTLVIAVLAALGIGGVTAITSLLPTQDSLAVALSTIAVVALFDPLRRRVVDRVDRRFDRTRYVARQVVEGFGRDVQDVTDLDEIGDRVHAVIGRTMAPTTVAVWQPPPAGSP